jgi:hypothetical protein
VISELEAPQVADRSVFEASWMRYGFGRRRTR